MTTKGILDHVDATQEARLARLFDLIRIPSVSTDPAFAPDVARAADWLVATLEEMGARARAVPTSGHPMVVGHLEGPKGAPHVLFYGHYDVQPVDPIALWTSDPFEPILREVEGDTHIVGRGASDDKGALMTFVEACRAYKAVAGALPIGVTFLFEGEEESGSRSLPGFLEAHKDELGCDLILVCDTDMWGKDMPAITTSLRGLVGQEVTVTAGDRDLHSGMFGNAAANAAAVLTQALATLRAPDGSVSLQGFYDDIPPLDPARKAAWEALPFDEKGFLQTVGRSQPAGEEGYSVLEQVWYRPSCEINGIWGGYTEAGFKTVIPAKASAKVSFRLAAGQDPEAVKAAFQAHMRAAMPEDCQIAFEDHGLSPAWAGKADNPYLQPALGALAAEWGQSTICGTGGTIPIIGALNGILGVDALLVGFARFDNRIHSPNEKYDLSSFNGGTRAWVRVIEALGR